jgi:phage shock protein A
VSSSEGLPAAASVAGEVGEARAAQTSTSALTSTSTDAEPALELSPDRVAERMAVLDAVGELSLADHVGLYQRLHEELQSALAEIDGP